MPAGLTSELDHRGGSSQTEHVSPPPIKLSARHDHLQNEDQNHQGRAHSSIAPALVADPVAGRRASSPSSSLRPLYPVNRLFSPSSSRHTQLLATSSHTHTPSKHNRFSDAFAGLGGRARTVSSTSNARRTDVVAADTIANSSFGIDADPFASHLNSSFSQTSHSPATTSSHPPSSFIIDNLTSRKQRGSLLYVASDALGFSRVGASLSKRIGKQSTVEHRDSTSVVYTPTQSKSRIGSLWRGRTRTSGQWALQPSSSTQAITDVIEISAAKSGIISPHDEDENERKERERLREAAAESIGISPYFREEASSRYAGTDSHFEAESIGDDDSTNDNRFSLEDDPAKRPRIVDASFATSNGSIVPNGKLPGKQLQQLQSRETRHHRSSSLSAVVTGSSPPVPPWPTPRHEVDAVDSKAGFWENSTSASEQLFPVFSAQLSSFEPFIRKGALVQKHNPASLLAFGLSRQWKSRFIILTAPPQAKAPSSNLPKSFAPSRKVTSSHYLHLFKSSAPNEREIERLEINSDSLAFVSDEEIAGKRSAVKIVGLDVGAKGTDTSGEVFEQTQTMWLILFADAFESQNWIADLKNVINAHRLDKTGFNFPMLPGNNLGPKDDDVLLSLRAQDLASTVRHYVENAPIIPRPNPNRTTSPTPTIRSWSGDGRPASVGRMVSLKGLFSVPSRTRSASRQPSRAESPALEQSSSFTSRGSALMNMTDTSNGHTITGVQSSITPPQTLPPPSISIAPIIPPQDMNLDQLPSDEGERELPDWYPHNHTKANGTAKSTGTSVLLPPPRSKRAWTSAGLLSHGRREQEDERMASRRSLQDTVSVVGGRLSIDERRRSADSVGTANGVFGNADQVSQRASLSSSVSSFASPPSDFGRPTSFINRRSRMSNIPKMLTPPTGPPPSVPGIQKDQTNGKDGATNNANDFSASRSSSARSLSNSEAIYSDGLPASRRLSDSSAFSVGSASTSQSRLNALNAIRRSTISNIPSKRVSMPPPRPAPTFAPPPTPDQSVVSKASGNTTRRSFRESFSPRSLKFSLTPPPSKVQQASEGEDADTVNHRRSFSNGTSSSKHLITATPPAPPPTGPLPPTPSETPVPIRYSFRERLRMKSAPSSPGALRSNVGPPTAFPGSPPLVTVSSVSSLRELPPSPVIGEPITTITKEFNFLNMASPVDTNPTLAEDFLNMSPTTNKPKSADLHNSFSESNPHSEMTALPAPPRRLRNGTITEKDKERSSQSLIDSTAVDDALPVGISVGSIGSIATI